MSKVSVLMPVFNNSKYLKASIDSVLNQTHTDLEFIIIDDGSTEPVWEILSAYEDSRIIKIKNDHNIGLTKSLNKCLKVATGEYIARQDSDDVSVSNRFEEQLKHFYDKVGIVTTWGYAINEKGERIPYLYLDKSSRILKISEEDIRKRNFLVCATAMFSHKVYEKIGFFDEKLYLAQGYNYWIRALKFFNVNIVPQELYIVRKHAKSVRTMHTEFKNIDWITVCRERADKCPIIN
jgi:glycosyltransferase involved in cell wall biosynthesis